MTIATPVDHLPLSLGVAVSMDAVRLSWQLEDRGLIVDLDDDNRLVVSGEMLDVVRNTRVVETRCHPHLRYAWLLRGTWWTVRLGRPLRRFRLRRRSRSNGRGSATETGATQAGAQRPTCSSLR